MDWNCEGLNRVFECDGPSVITLNEEELTPVYDARVSYVRGSVWVNNGFDHKMVFEDEIPDGWVLGRINVHSDKEQFRQQGLNNNSNAKTYKIMFRNGDVVECHQLSKWARDNNINYGSLKRVVYRTKYHQNQQFYCKSSPVSHIESIHVI